MTTDAPTPGTWLAHDIVMGVLSGGAVGLIAGLFAMARVSDSPLFALFGAVLGAAIGVFGLLRSHRRNQRFLTATVVVAWVLLVLAVIFLAALYDAIANFT